MNINVTVVIAAKNEEKYIRDALESVLSQVGVIFELIFVDDNSTDKTLDIATELAKKYNNLRVFSNPKKGKCSAFNYGISFAKGEYACIFAGDDIMPQGSLAERYAVVKYNENTVPVVGLSKLITMSDMAKFDGHLVPKAKGRGALSGVSPMMNKLALNLIFPVPENLPNEDTWMELAVLHMSNLKVFHSDVICCKWRVHSGNSLNMTLSFREYNKRMTLRLMAFEQFLTRFKENLNSDQYKTLVAKVECEEKRKSGDWFGVLISKVSIVDKLRALSMTNAFFYNIRRALYGLFTGW